MEITKVEDNSVEIQGWDAFEAKYKPVINYIHSDKYPDAPIERMFETFGADFDYIKRVDFRRVWTWVDGDMSSLLVPGIAYVNRLGYYVTEVPWENDLDYVLLSVEKECECYDEARAEEGGEYGDPDCKICEGYGLVTEYVD